uniref:Portal protein n=1 Tax=viral metagenome TaxID=1070528 RepID=A0A6M3JEE3_9ZZZZ
MPNIIATESSSSGITYGNLNYTYPRGLDLRPGSTLHNEILSKLNLRAQESSREISKRHKSWKKIDRTLTAYIPADEAEKKVQDNDERKPISIVIPYSFATLETLLTYLVAAFLDYPIFKYEGSSPEDRFGAILLEKVIEVQSRRAKMALSLHTTFRDAWAYGIGVSAPYWDKVYGKKTRIVDSGFLSAIFGSWIATGQKKQSQDTTLYEGNMLKNVDPYMFLPDPNVPIQDVQKGEFAGWIETTNYMKILEQEQKDPTYFNGRYLQGTQGSNAQSAWNKAKSSSGREDHFNFGSGSGQAPYTTSPVDQYYMYINLIPKEWKLGTSEYPEKWLFCVAADKYIRCAKPLGLDHNMFPLVTCSPDFDGYSVTPVSRLEVISGLQGTLDFLINSHIQNVRKSINDMLVVDPSLININDLLDPSPGKLIRMRRAAWGRGVDDAVKQLEVTDITQNHIRDSAYITELIKTCSGSVDSVMGLARSGSERVSAAEAQGTRMSALSRLAKAAKVVSLQTMNDLGYMLASHTQQLMSQNLYVSMTGRWEDDLRAEFGDVTRKMVNPFDIVIDYDIVEADGSIPGDGDTQTLVQLFQTIATNPLLASQFDTVRIFQRIARMSGVKDLGDFKAQKQLPPVQATTLPDGTVASEASKGNLIPV